MSVTFLDDAPPAGTSDGGAKLPGVTWLDDDSHPSAPASPSAGGADDVAAKLSDPNYVPTQAEYEAWARQQKEKPWFRPADWADSTIQAAKGIKDIAVKGGKELLTSNPISPDRAQTVLEAGARGTVRDIQSAQKLMENAGGGLGKLFGVEPGLSQDQYLYIKLMQANDQAFPNGRDPSTVPLTFNDVPAKTLDAWKQEFKADYKPKAEYQAFLDHRQEQLDALKTASGQNDLVPHVLGTPNQDLTEAMSLVTSPASLVGLGAGGAAEKGATLLQRGTGAALRGTGKALSTLGRFGEAAAALPGEMLNKGVTFLTESPEAAEKAVSEAANVRIPIVTDALNTVKTAVKPVAMTGDALQAAGRAMATGPSRTGLLGTIASDGAAPKWIRIAAGAGQGLDPALGFAGSVAEGAVHGAAIGGALGGATEGNAEGVFGGIGSGGALGAGFAGVGRLSTSQLEAKRQGDLNRWFNSKSPDEQANIASMNLSGNDALRFATLEQIARGIRGAGGEGDVKFVYAPDQVFQQAFGGSAKGAEFVQGEQPTVVINTDRANAATLPHEVFHGLWDLAVDPQAKLELQRKLFTQVDGNGNTLTQGVFSPDDIAKMEDQYVSRLHQAGKVEWATLTPDERRAKITNEIAADAFANLVQSKHADYLLRDVPSVTRRLADRLLQAQEDSVLGQFRKGLERVGVKFDAVSGMPSELFVRNGKPITNSPEVDAALRDYLRAKMNVRSRLTADEDAPSAFVATRQDLLGKNGKAIAELYKDNDNFAKDAQGNVKFAAGQPVLLSEREIKQLQANRTEQMLRQLDSVPDDGTPGAVRRKDNDAYEGKFFTPAQLDALDRVPNSVLAPSLKEKLRAINQYHQAGDGSRLLLDYNAATKEKKGGGRIYSSAIKSTLRDVVPISIHISKAGNFYTTSADTTVLFSKLNRWLKEKRGAFDAWGGDRDAVVRDLFKYLDNHANGREGSVGLDAGAATAVTKKNVLNDLFGVARGTGNNPIELSVKGGKDQIVRSFRFDRTNRITESGGDKMPFDYQKQKVNFLPPRVGMELQYVGKDFPEDQVKPGLLNIKGSNEDIVNRVAPIVSAWPDTITAADGSEIRLKNPEGQSMAARVRHLIFDNDTRQMHAGKAQWVPMVPDTLSQAAVRLVDPKSGNLIYVRAYQGGDKHMVTVAPAGQVIAQKAFKGKLITQFPELAPSRQGRMVMDWVRKGSGQLQGIPSPTPTGSTVPVPRQSAFRGDSSIPPKSVNPLIGRPDGVNFLPAPQGKEFTATTPTAGVEVKGKYEVHEAKDLISSFDQGFDPTLQPRDRSRQASVNQMATIVQKFEPQRLGEAPTTDMGAPIIDDQRQVLSGNGRTTSLRTIYNSADPAKANAYKDYLTRNAAQFGLQPGDISGMTEPVLVRKVEDYGGLSKAEFARQSNQSQLLAMSGAEKAGADARMLTEHPELLDKFAPSDEGNVLAESNHEFLNHFIQATGDGAELLTEHGYNQEPLRKRVETAIMATLIGPEHRDLLTKLVERADKFKMRKAVNGLLQASSKLVRLKGTDYDMGGYLQEALANLIRMRGSGEKVEQFLASKALIGGSDRTAAGDHVLEFLAKARSMKQVNEDLGRYFSMARNAIADAQSGGLFGDAPRTREQLVAEIYGQLQRNSPQYPAATQPNQPPGQPAPLAATTGPQPAGPGLALQFNAPGPAAPTATPAPAVAPPAAAPVKAPPPAAPSYVSRPRLPGLPDYITRPMPRRSTPLPGLGAVQPPDQRKLSPQSLIQHHTATAISTLSDRIRAAGVPLTTNTRQQLSEYYVKRLDATRRSDAPDDRRTAQLAAIAALTERVTPTDMQGLSTALRAHGLRGAYAEIDRQVALKSALENFKLQFSPASNT